MTFSVQVYFLQAEGLHSHTERVKAPICLYSEASGPVSPELMWIKIWVVGSNLRELQ